MLGQRRQDYDRSISIVSSTALMREPPRSAFWEYALFPLLVCTWEFGLAISDQLFHPAFARSSLSTPYWTWRWLKLTLPNEPKICVRSTISYVPISPVMVAERIRKRTWVWSSCWHLVTIPTRYLFQNRDRRSQGTQLHVPRWSPWASVPQVIPRFPR